MKKIFGAGILAGIAILASDLVVGKFFEFIFPAIKGEYQSGVFRPWSDPRMMLYFLYPFIVGLILAFAWSKIKIFFTDKTTLNRGMNFGLLAWLFFVLPGMFVTYTSFVVSL